jgi:hypothetical protein
MSIKGTLLRFTGWYVLLLMVALLILELLGVGQNSGVNLGIVLGATVLACRGFTKRNKRIFTPQEKKAALWGMWAVDLTLQALFTVIFLSSLDAGLLVSIVVVFAVVGVVHLGVIYLGILLSGLEHAT